MMTHAGWSRCTALTVGVGVLLLAPQALAGNGLKPRVPVDWLDPPCMTIVDRSVNSGVHFDYGISMEDTELTSDELDDSRTHQFFALCRSYDPQTFLPRWITQADIDRAGTVDAAPLTVEPDDIFESSTFWADCWYRINADDARHPITYDVADMGVSWDTTGVPAGAYVIDGYTWEPAINIWARRRGVIKVVDEPAIEASGPALAVMNEEEVINKNETVLIEGCASAMDGSTISAFWGRPDAEVDWVPFVEDQSLMGDEYSVEFAPPEELAGDSVMIRVDITDPMGRAYTNYMYDLVIILGSDLPDCPEDGGGFIGGAGCPEDDSDSSGGVDGGTEGTTGSADGGTQGSGPPSVDDGGTTPGCGCQSSTPPPAAALMLLGLWGWRRRPARS